MSPTSFFKVNRCGLLLVALLLYLVVDPFTRDGGAGRLLFNALGTVVIFSAVYATASRTRHLAIFAILISRLASLYRREHDPS